MRGGEEVLSVQQCDTHALPGPQQRACAGRAGSPRVGFALPLLPAWHTATAQGRPLSLRGGGGQVGPWSWTQHHGFGESFDQASPGRTASCDPRTKIALSLLHSCRRLCSGSEMPTPIKREMSNLCQLRICILAVVFVFDSPVSTSLERVTKIIVEVSGDVTTQAGFASSV